MQGRQRRSFTDDISGKVDLVASSGARSDRWPRNLACAIQFCGAGWNYVGWARADGGGAAPHNAGDAAVGGPRGGDRSSEARERAAAYGARHLRKSIAIFAGGPK
jgi:hypothetical protein